MRHKKKTNATEKYQDEIIDHNDTNENPLIQAMPNKWVEEACKNAQVKSPFCSQNNVSKKI